VISGTMILRYGIGGFTLIVACEAAGVVCTRSYEVSSLLVSYCRGGEYADAR